MQQSINNRKKLTKEAVNKIYRILREKAKGANSKNTFERKILEKDKNQKQHQVDDDSSENLLLIHTKSKRRRRGWRKVFVFLKNTNLIFFKSFMYVQYNSEIF